MRARGSGYQTADLGRRWRDKNVSRLLNYSVRRSDMDCCHFNYTFCTADLPIFG